MMKNEYISPELEIITFDQDDVIFNSGQEDGETGLANNALPNRLFGEDSNDYKQYKN